MITIKSSQPQCAAVFTDCEFLTSASIYGSGHKLHDDTWPAANENGYASSTQSVPLLFSLLAMYKQLDGDRIPLKYWTLFIRAVALAFLCYWLHLGTDLNDWLGSDGFHLASPAGRMFAPLAMPWPHFLWDAAFAGTILMFFGQTTAIGCLIAGSAFGYATLCDPASTGALNMHFIFAFAVIFWGACLKHRGDIIVSAWPVYLIRVYLVVVYFGSGWRKVIYGDWLDKSDTLIHCLTGFYTTDLTRRIYPFVPYWGWTLFQYITIAFELGAPLLLLYKPLRTAGIILGCLLHLGIALLMKDLFYFSFQMTTFYIPFLTPIITGSADVSKRSRKAT